MPVAARIAVATLVLVGTGLSARGDPGVELTDGGRTIVYRARPGDTPTAVAQALGVPPAQLEPLLSAGGIANGERVPVGFEYRVPNPLASRADAAEQRVGDLERRSMAAEARAAQAEARLAGTQRSEELRAEQRLRLAQLEGRWLLARWAILGLALALSIAGAVAAVARRRELGSKRYARTMAHELEERRRTGLSERQHAARRIGELEEQVRQLERQLGTGDGAVPRSA